MTKIGFPLNCFIDIQEAVKLVEKVYAKKIVIVRRFHFGLIYPVSLQVNKNARIGGVNQETLDKYVSAHSDLQAWDRQSYGSGKSILLVPKRYVFLHWKFASEIYLGIKEQ